MKQDSNSTSKLIKCLRNQGGQAAIEYVLILIVTVSLLLFASKFFTGLGKYITNYMGDYVVCLMDYGELPTLHVTDTDLKNHKDGGHKCTPAFSAQLDPKFGKNGSGGPASSSFSAKPGVNSETGFGTADGASSKSSSKIKVTDEDEAGGDKRNRGAFNDYSSRNSSSRNNYRGITGRMAEEIEKNIKKSSRVPSSKTVSDVEEGYRLKLYKKTFNPPEPKKFSDDEKSTSFSFGYLIKWLLIIGMLLAILVLMGGQVLNYSNSKDQ